MKEKHNFSWHKRMYDTLHDIIWLSCDNENCSQIDHIVKEKYKYCIVGDYMDRVDSKYIDIINRLNGEE